jgi:hypothetical protein
MRFLKVCSHMHAEFPNFTAHSKDRKVSVDAILSLGFTSSLIYWQIIDWTDTLLQEQLANIYDQTLRNVSFEVENPKNGEFQYNTSEFVDGWW